MASNAIEKVIAGYDRMKTAAKNAKLREHIEKQNTLAMGGAIAAAALAGVVDAKYNADGTSTKTTIALAGTGLVLGAAGVTDYIPGGLVVGMSGVGILCYVIGAKANQKAKEHFAAA